MLPRLRNPYAAPVDYAELAKDVPMLAPFLRPARDGRQTIDFHDDAAVRALNAALLRRDFHLEIQLPEDRLCPAVPSRLEYALYVLQLALITDDSSSAPSLVGLDVGTGSSAIYPLLAVHTLTAATVPGAVPAAQGSAGLIRMLATDIDVHSLRYARRNVERNALTDRISVFQVERDGALFPPAVVDSVERIDFTMCNPPFYSSQSEIDASFAVKELEPFATCTGAENEMVTPGGEVAFVSRMIEESLVVGCKKIRWFTSLLGKYSSIAPLVALLKAEQILNYHVHALPPHGHTVRWILSWSLQDRRFPHELLESTALSGAGVSRPPAASTPRFPLARFASPAVTSSTYYTPPFASTDDASDDASVLRTREAIEEVLRELCGGTSDTDARGSAPGGEGDDRDQGEDERQPKRRRAASDTGATRDGAAATQAQRPLNWHWVAPSAASSGSVQPRSDTRNARAELFVRAWRNVWSRKARRGATGTGVSTGGAGAPCPLIELRVCLERVTNPPTLASGGPDAAGAAQVKLTAVWIRGLDADRAAFTGLWGFVTRKVGERLKGGPEGTQGGRIAGGSDGVGAGGEGGAGGSGG